MTFSEDFLHYLWKFRLFNQQELQTIDGESLEIISVGFHNQHAGPDFENARIRIGSHTWAGNIEIHIRSSDWERHGHQQDLAYDSVILHVVYEADAPVLRPNGTEISQLSLHQLISPSLIHRYKQLMEGLNWIPCEKLITQVDKIHIDTWLSRILIERLEEKSGIILSNLNEYKGSWDDAFYISLARNFGFKTNALPFELLARSLPQNLLAKHKNNPRQIEALIFGQAGFLAENQQDVYFAELKKEYEFLQSKYALRSVDRFVWKYLRLRPYNFPSVRLAQFAALVVKSSHLFSRIVEIEDVKQLSRLFEELPINPYWQTHFRVGNPSVQSSKQMGRQSIHNVLINTVATSLFAYGRQMGQQKYTERALALLESIPAETNQVLSRFNSMGLRVDKADVSQALMQLKSTYCDAKKCLNCGIGIKLMKQEEK